MPDVEREFREHHARSPGVCRRSTSARPVVRRPV
jgi:hypothetical protein